MHLLCDIAKELLLIMFVYSISPTWDYVLSRRQDRRRLKVKNGGL